MNPFDLLIELAAPRLALERAKARRKLDYMRKSALAYDAAASGRFTATWRSATAGSANAETLRGLGLIRYRCRDLARNNGWGRQAVRRLTTLVAGTGFTPRIKGRLAEAWRRWAGVRSCDHANRNRFRALQRAAVRSWLECGEVFLARRIDRTLEVPLRVQLLEADLLDDSRNETLKGGGRIVQGVELDAEGRRVAYWFFDEHPGEPGARPTSRRIPAADIAHVFDEERVGQARGVPRLTPCVIKTRDLFDYTEAELIRAKVAASVCYFEIDADPDAAAAKEPGQDGGPAVREVQPGTIERLGPGRRVEAPMKIDVGNYREFGTFTLFEIAAGAGMPYEVLTGDLVNVNYSSAKIGQAPFFAEVDELREFVVVETLLNIVYEWWVDAARLAGRAGFATADRVTEWQPPRRLVMDPAKETSANREAVRCGFKTLSDVARESGRDFEELLEEYADDVAAVDARNLALDVDVRRATAPGSAPTGAGAPAPDGGQDDDEEVGS